MKLKRRLFSVTNSNARDWLITLYKAFQGLESAIGYVEKDGIIESTSLVPTLVTARWERPDGRRSVEVTLGVRRAGSINLTTTIRNQAGEGVLLEGVRKALGFDSVLVHPQEFGSPDDNYLVESASAIIACLVNDVRMITMDNEWIDVPFDWAGYR
ncbi:MAG: hypothetical protein ABIU18_05140 [Novosphingobium sp.]